MTNNYIFKCVICDHLLIFFKSVPEGVSVMIMMVLVKKKKKKNFLQSGSSCLLVVGSLMQSNPTPTRHHPSAYMLIRYLKAPQTNISGATKMARNIVANFAVQFRARYELG